MKGLYEGDVVHRIKLLNSEPGGNACSICEDRTQHSPKMQLCPCVLLRACSVLCSIKHMLRLPHAQAASMVEGFAQQLFERMAGLNKDDGKVSACPSVSLHLAPGRQ